MTSLQKCLTIVAAWLTATGVAAAQAVPAPGEGVAFEQRLATPLPLDLKFQDEQGQTITLGSCFRGKPVIVTPVYYKCPMLCGLELNGLVRCLRAMSLTAGQDFDIVTFSIDPREPASLARQKKKQYLSQYDRAGSDWRFLTGEQESITALCETIGFKARFDEATGQYSHAAGIVVCTPDGVISRYQFGVEFNPRDLRLALVESGQGEIGSLVDHVLMFCYRYDPAQGRYGLAILNILRAGGVGTVLVVGGGIVWMLQRERNGLDRALLARGGSVHE